MKLTLLRRVAIVLFLLAMMSTGVYCQNAHKTDTPANATTAHETGNTVLYPVKLDGQTVIQIGWGYKNFSAPLRVSAIEQRLHEVAEDVSLPESVTTNPTDLTIDLLAGDRLIASVFDGDAQQGGASKEVLAQQWQSSFTHAIVRYRHEHTRQKLLLRAALTVLILGGAFGLLWALGPLTRRAMNAATARSMTGLQSSKRRSLSLIDTEQLREIIHLVVNTLRLLLSVLILYVAFHFLLSIFPQTSGIADEMLSAVMDPVKGFGHSAWRSAPSLVFIVIIAIVCRYVLHFVAFAFGRIKQGSVTIEGFGQRGLPRRSG